MYVVGEFRTLGGQIGETLPTHQVWVVGLDPVIPAGYLDSTPKCGAYLVRGIMLIFALGEVIQ